MPRVNIYIRKDDWEAWNNIDDKPAWIHEGLTTGFVMIPAKSTGKPHSQEFYGKSVIDIVEEDNFSHPCKHPSFNKRTRVCPDCGYMN